MTALEARGPADAAAAGTLVMGILNVTPDSFSDGGRWTTTDAALGWARELLDAGADIIDVGGESTRPHATPVEPDEEQRRILPVIRELAAGGVRVSVDTMHAATAEAAASAGASIINDVSGGLADAAMARVAAESGLHYVAMHWRGHSDRMDGLNGYDDIVNEVRDELASRVDSLLEAGVRRDRLVIDPGLGFAKIGEQNWELLRGLDVLGELGLPVLVGASRKRFVGGLLPAGAPMAARDLPSAVISVLAARAGAWGVRVHDVAATRLALDTLAAFDGGVGALAPGAARPID